MWECVTSCTLVATHVCGRMHTHTHTHRHTLTHTRMQKTHTHTHTVQAVILPLAWRDHVHVTQQHVTEGYETYSRISAHLTRRAASQAALNSHTRTEYLSFQQPAKNNFQLSLPPTLRKNKKCVCWWWRGGGKVLYLETWACNSQVWLQK